MSLLKPPCSYQGAKVRIASQLVDHWWPLGTDQTFYDICSGSGAVSLEMVNRGFESSQIVMVECGPWGIFWHAIGSDEYPMDELDKYLSEIPSDRSLIQGYVKELSKLPASEDTAAVFVILQAASFGGKAIWINDDDTWGNTSFRNYWQPTETSSRRSPVNPMMPMADEIRRRVEVLATDMTGVEVEFTIQEVDFWPGSSAYIDPPYQGTESYGYSLPMSVQVLAETLGLDVWVSEGVPLKDDAVFISSGRTKGGISGNRSKASEEWLTHYVASRMNA